MGMFANLGRTLSLLRELRGKSQSRVAREARIGKSQLSKYENGKELPKLDSLEKILRVLKVDMFEFFYTLYLVDGRAAALARAAAGIPQASEAGGGDLPPAAAEGDTAPDLAAAEGAATAAASPESAAPAEAAHGPLYLPPLPHQHPLLAEATDQAFARVFTDLLMLYRRVFEQVVLSGPGRPENLKV
jgi:transcriptional regulator with XRE-family HTH domain